MAYTVGPKGQVVIAKEIRDRLGVHPGWTVVQRVADDHVELYFVPPEHTRSLKGSLGRYGGVARTGGRRAEDTAWQESARDEWDA